MEEFKKKWFENVWLALLFVSLVIDFIQRKVDTVWAHGAAIEMLDKVFMWIIFPLTVLLFVLHNIESWRKGERYFWREWQKGTLALGVGGALALLLVILVKYYKGDALEIDNGGRIAIVAVFASIGFVYSFARYKFKNWREK
jgi:hypothetical protein